MLKLAGQQEVSGFLAKEGDGEVCFDAGAAWVSGQAIEAGGNINGDDGNACFVYFVGKLRGKVAVEACAIKRINDQFCACNVI